MNERLHAIMRANRAKLRPSEAQREEDMRIMLRQHRMRANNISASAGIDPPYANVGNYEVCMRVAANVRKAAAARKLLPWWRVDRWWW